VGIQTAEHFPQGIGVIQLNNLPL